MSNSLGHMTTWKQASLQKRNLFAPQRSIMPYSSAHLRTCPGPASFPQWQAAEDEKWTSMAVQPALSPVP